MRFFSILFGCPHAYGWPVAGVETCVLCSATRPAKIRFDVAPRFNVPKHRPKVRELTGIEKREQEVIRR